MLEPRGALSGRRLVAEVVGLLLLLVLAFGPPPESEPDPRLPIVIGLAVGIGATLARRRATRKDVDIAHLFLGGWAGAVAFSAVAQALLAAPRGESIERGIGYGVSLGFFLGLWLSGGLALIAYGLTKTGSTIVRISAVPQNDVLPADLGAIAGETVSAAGTRAPEDQGGPPFSPSEPPSEQPPSSRSSRETAPAVPPFAPMANADRSLWNRAFVSLQWVLPAAAALLFAFWVWPTLYRYHRTPSGRAGSMLVRENRVSGSLSVLRAGPTGASWRALPSAPARPIMTDDESLYQQYLREKTDAGDPLRDYRPNWRQEPTTPAQMDTGMRMDTVP